MFKFLLFHIFAQLKEEGGLVPDLDLSLWMPKLLNISMYTFSYLHIYIQVLSWPLVFQIASWKLIQEFTVLGYLYILDV